MVGKYFSFCCKIPVRAGRTVWSRSQNFCSGGLGRGTTRAGSDQLSIMESYTCLALVRQAVTSKETFRTRPAWEVNAPLAQERADIQHTNIHTDHQSIHFMNLHYIQLLHLCNLQLELKSLLEYPKISCLLNHMDSLHYSVTV